MAVEDQKSKVVSYNKGGIDIASPEEAGVKAIAYIRPNDLINLQFDPREVKLDIVEGDVNLIFKNGSIISIAGLGVLGFLSGSSPKIIHNGQQFLLEEFLTLTEVLPYDEAKMILAQTEIQDFSDIETDVIRSASDLQGTLEDGSSISGAGDSSIRVSGSPSSQVTSQAISLLQNQDAFSGSFTYNNFTSFAPFNLDSSAFAPGNIGRETQATLAFKTYYGGSLDYDGIVEVGDKNYNKYSFSNGKKLVADSENLLKRLNLDLSSSNEATFIDGSVNKNQYIVEIDYHQGATPHKIDIIIPREVASSIDSIKQNSNFLSSELSYIDTSAQGDRRYTITQLDPTGKMDLIFSILQREAPASFTITYQLYYKDPETNIESESFSVQKVFMGKILGPKDLEIAGEGAVIFSTVSSGLNVSTGTENDIIVGGGAGNNIVSEGGNNAIFSSDGNDEVSLGAGNDRYWGSSGFDRIHSSDGDNKAYYDNLKDDNLGLESSYFSTYNHASVAMYFGYDLEFIRSKINTEADELVTDELEAVKGYMLADLVEGSTALLMKGSSAFDVLSGFHTFNFPSVSGNFLYLGSTVNSLTTIILNSSAEDNQVASVSLENNFAGYTVDFLAEDRQADIYNSDNNKLYQLHGVSSFEGNSKSGEINISNYASALMIIGGSFESIANSNIIISYAGNSHSINVTGNGENFFISRGGIIDLITGFTEIKGTKDKDIYEGSYGIHLIYDASNNEEGYDKLKYSFSHQVVYHLASNKIYKGAWVADMLVNDLQDYSHDTIKGDITVELGGDHTVLVDSINDAYTQNDVSGSNSRLSYQFLDSGGINVTFSREDGVENILVNVDKGSEGKSDRFTIFDTGERNLSFQYIVGTTEDDRFTISKFANNKAVESLLLDAHKGINTLALDDTWSSDTGINIFLNQKDDYSMIAKNDSELQYKFKNFTSFEFINLEAVILNFMFVENENSNGNISGNTFNYSITGNTISAFFTNFITSGEMEFSYDLTGDGFSFFVEKDNIQITTIQASELTIRGAIAASGQDLTNKFTFLVNEDIFNATTINNVLLSYEGGSGDRVANELLLSYDTSLTGDVEVNLIGNNKLKIKDKEVLSFKGINKINSVDNNSKFDNQVTYVLSSAADNYIIHDVNITKIAYEANVANDIFIVTEGSLNVKSNTGDSRAQFVNLLQVDSKFLELEITLKAAVSIEYDSGFDEKSITVIREGDNYVQTKAQMDFSELNQGLNIILQGGSHELNIGGSTVTIKGINSYKGTHHDDTITMQTAADNNIKAYFFDGNIGDNTVQYKNAESDVTLYEMSFLEHDAGVKVASKTADGTLLVNDSLTNIKSIELDTFAIVYANEYLVDYDISLYAPDNSDDIDFDSDAFNKVELNHGIDKVVLGDQEMVFSSMRDDTATISSVHYLKDNNLEGSTLEIGGDFALSSKLRVEGSANKFIKVNVVGGIQDVSLQMFSDKGLDTFNNQEVSFQNSEFIFQNTGSVKIEIADESKLRDDRYKFNFSSYSRMDEVITIDYTKYEGVILQVNQDDDKLSFSVNKTFTTNIKHEYTVSTEQEVQISLSQDESNEWVINNLALNLEKFNVSMGSSDKNNRLKIDIEEATKLILEVDGDDGYVVTSSASSESLSLDSISEVKILTVVNELTFSYNQHMANIDTIEAENTESVLILSANYMVYDASASNGSLVYIDGSNNNNIVKGFQHIQVASTFSNATFLADISTEGYTFSGNTTHASSHTLSYAEYDGNITFNFHSDSFVEYSSNIKDIFTNIHQFVGSKESVFIKVEDIDENVGDTFHVDLSGTNIASLILDQFTGPVIDILLNNERELYVMLYDNNNNLNLNLNLDVENLVLTFGAQDMTLNGDIGNSIGKIIGDGEGGKLIFDYSSGDITVVLSQTGQSSFFLEQYDTQYELTNLKDLEFKGEYSKITLNYDNIIDVILRFNVEVATVSYSNSTSSLVINLIGGNINVSQEGDDASHSIIFQGDGGYIIMGSIGDDTVIFDGQDHSALESSGLITINGNGGLNTIDLSASEIVSDTVILDASGFNFNQDSLYRFINFHQYKLNLSELTINIDVEDSVDIENTNSDSQVMYSSSVSQAEFVTSVTFDYMDNKNHFSITRGNNLDTLINFNKVEISDGNSSRTSFTYIIEQAYITSLDNISNMLQVGFINNNTGTVTFDLTGANSADIQYQVGGSEVNIKIANKALFGFSSANTLEFILNGDATITLDMGKLSEIQSSVLVKTNTISRDSGNKFILSLEGTNEDITLTSNSGMNGLDYNSKNIELSDIYDIELDLESFNHSFTLTIASFASTGNQQYTLLNGVGDQDRILDIQEGVGKKIIFGEKNSIFTIEDQDTVINNSYTHTFTGFNTIKLLSSSSGHELVLKQFENDDDVQLMTIEAKGSNNSISFDLWKALDLDWVDDIVIHFNGYDINGFTRYTLSQHGDEVKLGLHDSTTIDANKNTLTAEYNRVEFDRTDTDTDKAVLVRLISNADISIGAASVIHNLTNFHSVNIVDDSTTDDPWGATTVVVNQGFFDNNQYNDRSLEVTLGKLSTHDSEFTHSTSYYYPFFSSFRKHTMRINDQVDLNFKFVFSRDEAPKAIGTVNSIFVFNSVSQFILGVGSSVTLSTTNSNYISNNNNSNFPMSESVSNFSLDSQNVNARGQLLTVDIQRSSTMDSVGNMYSFRLFVLVGENQTAASHYGWGSTAPTHPPLDFSGVYDYYFDFAFQEILINPMTTPVTNGQTSTVVAVSSIISNVSFMSDESRLRAPGLEYVFNTEQALIMDVTISKIYNKGGYNYAGNYDIVIDDPNNSGNSYTYESADGAAVIIGLPEVSGNKVTFNYGTDFTQIENLGLQSNYSSSSFTVKGEAAWEVELKGVYGKGVSTDAPLLSLTGSPMTGSSQVLFTLKGEWIENSDLESSITTVFEGANKITVELDTKKENQGFIINDLFNKQSDYNDVDTDIYLKRTDTDGPKYDLTIGGSISNSLSSTGIGIFRNFVIKKEDVSVSGTQYKGNLAERSWDYSVFFNKDDVASLTHKPMLPYSNTTDRHVTLIENIEVHYDAGKLADSEILDYGYQLAIFTYVGKDEDDKLTVTLDKFNEYQNYEGWSETDINNRDLFLSLYDIEKNAFFWMDLIFERTLENDDINTFSMSYIEEIQVESAFLEFKFDISVKGMYDSGEGNTKQLLKVDDHYRKNVLIITHLLGGGSTESDEKILHLEIKDMEGNQALIINNKGYVVNADEQFNYTFIGFSSLKYEDSNGNEVIPVLDVIWEFNETENQGIAELISYVFDRSVQGYTTTIGSENHYTDYNEDYIKGGKIELSSDITMTLNLFSGASSTVSTGVASIQLQGMTNYKLTNSAEVKLQYEHTAWTEFGMNYGTISGNGIIFNHLHTGRNSDGVKRFLYASDMPTYGGLDFGNLFTIEASKKLYKYNQFDYKINDENIQYSGTPNYSAAALFLSIQNTNLVGLLKSRDTNILSNQLHNNVTGNVVPSGEKVAKLVNFSKYDLKTAATQFMFYAEQDISSDAIDAIENLRSVQVTLEENTAGGAAFYLMTNSTMGDSSKGNMLESVNLVSDGGDTMVVNAEYVHGSKSATMAIEVTHADFIFIGVAPNSESLHGALNYNLEEKDFYQNDLSEFFLYNPITLSRMNQYYSYMNPVHNVLKEAVNIQYSEMGNVPTTGVRIIQAAQAVGDAAGQNTVDFSNLDASDAYITSYRIETQGIYDSHDGAQWASSHGGVKNAWVLFKAFRGTQSNSRVDERDYYGFNILKLAQSNVTQTVDWHAGNLTNNQDTHKMDYTVQSTSGLDKVIAYLWAGSSVSITGNIGSPSISPNIKISFIHFVSIEIEGLKSESDNGPMSVTINGTGFQKYLLSGTEVNLILTGLLKDKEIYFEAGSYSSISLEFTATSEAWSDGNGASGIKLEEEVSGNTIILVNATLDDLSLFYTGFRDSILEQENDDNNQEEETQEDALVDLVGEEIGVLVDADNILDISLDVQVDGLNEQNILQVDLGNQGLMSNLNSEQTIDILDEVLNAEDSIDNLVVDNEVVSDLLLDMEDLTEAFEITVLDSEVLEDYKTAEEKEKDHTVDISDVASKHHQITM